MRLGKSRPLRERSLEVRERLDRPVKAAKGVAAIGQDLRMPGQQRERRVIARYRLDRTIEPNQRIAAVDEHPDMGCVLRERLIIIRERLVDAAEFKARIAEVVEDLRMEGSDQQGVAITANRFLKASHCMERETKI